MQSPTLKYGSRQALGRLLQQWIESPESDPPGETCPILPSKLKFKDLKKCKKLEIDIQMHPYLPIQIEYEFEQHGIMGPTGGAWDMVSIEEPDAPRDPEYPHVHTWKGQIAPGVLMIEEIKKIPGFFMSEVCQAIYQNYFPIDSLKYVYMIDVCNKDTRSFVMDELYTEANGYTWEKDTINCIPGTPEFEALLGTKLGRTVAHLVLGAFKRGTRRISQIKVFDNFEALQLEFSIVPTDAPAQSSSTRSTRSKTRREQNIESRKRKRDSSEEPAKKRLKRGK
ncbi:uncharacterized protein N7518_008992 [Penicillium psychrosexuale]|uniref:uncharacterized protein n=1 Tax=Penicillium psychrosexuale TaxID=1002107 RepID=UPI002544E32D|nr:uncharacterized protein N7518_008992 [Penicillium psychrosexuale]KAJ5783315.1 hypothetical protein N7518_008992 [Penicillium psychrosexuale]